MSSLFRGATTPCCLRCRRQYGPSGAVNGRKQLAVDLITDLLHGKRFQGMRTGNSSHNHVLLFSPSCAPCELHNVQQHTMALTSTHARQMMVEGHKQHPRVR